jgi:hypothetical protein
MSTPRLTQIAERSGFNYRVAVAKGDVSGAKAFEKVGYNPAITTTEEDIWSGGAVYVFPTAAAQWRIAAGNAGDLGTVIKGNAEGADQTIKCDAGGSTTVLIDANVNFTAATGVAVGDCVLLDPKGTNPEYGFITDITNAATGTLVIGGGFSNGGSCATARAYTIVDYSGAAGAQVVKLEYLTSAYVEKTILICLNAGTAVELKGSGGAALTDTFRVNSFRVIAAGSGGVPVAAIQLQLLAAPNTVYGYITAGYHRARNSAYTVPAGKVLYISDLALGAATNNDTKVQTARIAFKANAEPSTGFKTPNIFFTQFEVLISNGQLCHTLGIPYKIVAGIDIKVSCTGLTGFTGPAMSCMRGWTEKA